MFRGSTLLRSATVATALLMAGSSAPAAAEQSTSIADMADDELIAYCIETLTCTEEVRYDDTVPRWVHDLALPGASGGDGEGGTLKTPEGRAHRIADTLVSVDAYNSADTGPGDADTFVDAAMGGSLSDDYHYIYYEPVYYGFSRDGRFVRVGNLQVGGDLRWSGRTLKWSQYTVHKGGPAIRRQHFWDCVMFGAGEEECGTPDNYLASHSGPDPSGYTFGRWDRPTAAAPAKWNVRSSYWNGKEGRMRMRWHWQAKGYSGYWSWPNPGTAPARSFKWRCRARPYDCYWP
jgi:hypothetical protein